MANSNFYANIGVNAGYSVSKNSNNFHVARDVESQTIEYATNPGKLKEDIGKAKEEINDIKWAIKESIHDRGDDNRNFFEQLREVRLSETVNNIAGKDLMKLILMKKLQMLLKMLTKI